MTDNFYMVDVFAEQPYQGNQLAVVVDQQIRPDDTMQQLAAETNFSETTFVSSKPDADGGYGMRIFTPAHELDFAGHPILGTAWVLREYVLAHRGSVVALNLTVGQVPVTFEAAGNEREVAWFQAPAMSLGARVAREDIAPALGIAADDIDSDAPVQTVAAGTSAVIVPLRSLDALRKARLDLDRYSALAKKGFPPLTYLFCRQTHHRENDLCARFFFDAHGVREDPATGNGAAFLGTYLLQHQYLSDTDLSLRIEQGHEVHRPSLIMLRARISDGTHDVRVGGQVIPTLRGSLL